MTTNLSLASNPFANQSQQNTGDAKIAQMKKEQEAKRADLFSIMEEYRESYKAADKLFAEKQSIFLMQQRELARLDENDKDYNTQSDITSKAKKEFSDARSDKDLRLSLLQYRTDNYVKAGRINLLDLA